MRVRDEDDAAPARVRDNNAEVRHPRLLHSFSARRLPPQLGLLLIISRGYTIHSCTIFISLQATPTLRRFSLCRPGRILAASFHGEARTSGLDSQDGELSIGE